jgi:SAM-dependent methyltransferase
MRELTRLEQRVLPGQVRHAERVLPCLLPQVSPRMRVLDFGNGSGAVAHTLAQKSGARVVGVDVAQNSLFPIPVVAYDGERLPFRNGTFDLVYAVFVVHHCPDVPAILKEMVRVSRGRILLVEDVWTNWKNRFWLYFFHVLFDLFMFSMTLLGRAEWSSYFRYHFKDEAGWRACFGSLGCKVVQAEDLVMHPRYPVRHRVYVVEKGAER